MVHHRLNSNLEIHHMIGSKPQYADSSDAPTIFFDCIARYGVMDGVIQIEIAGSVMVPRQDGGVDIKFVPTGRLRCSAEAARALRQSLDIALSMAEHPRTAPGCSGHQAELAY
jgi:hypothetical protein